MKAKMEFLFGLIVTCVVIFGWKVYSMTQSLFELMTAIFLWGIWIRENSERK